MNPLVETLYTLSTALLIPVIVLLLGFVAWSLLEIGGFVREARDRRKFRSTWDSFQTRQQHCINSSDTLNLAEFFDSANYPGLLGKFAQQGHTFFRNEPRLSKLVSDLEIEAAGRLARMNAGVRLAPILGLMGTLIPMGPALIGLAAGNIDELARNLVVAFSTTVLGLFTGGICYTLLSVRRQWYARDLGNIEYLFGCLHDHDEETATDAKTTTQLPAGALRPSTIAQ